MKNEIVIFKKDDIVPFVPEKDIDAIIRMMNHAASDPTIATCELASVQKSILDAVSLKLSPLKENGEAYFIPRGNKCTLQVGYRGYIQLAARFGWILRSELVCVGDTFDVHDEDGRVRYTHKFNPFDKERGALQGAYAVAYPIANPNLLMIEAAHIDEINKAQKMSKSDSWNKWADEMRRKFTIRRLWKKLPHDLSMNEVEARAVFDDAGVGYLDISETKPDATTQAKVVEVVDIPAEPEKPVERKGKQVKTEQSEPLSEPVVHQMTDDEKREDAKKKYIGSFKIETLNADAITNLKAMGVEIFEGVLCLSDRKKLDSVYRYLKNRE